MGPKVEQERQVVHLGVSAPLLVPLRWGEIGDVVGHSQLPCGQGQVAPPSWLLYVGVKPEMSRDTPSSLVDKVK